jgi:hypothetical protein
MVKLNLLEVPEKQVVTREKEQKGVSEEEKSNEGQEFSIDSVDQLFKSKEKPTPLSIEEEPEVEVEKLPKPKPSPSPEVTQRRPQKREFIPEERFEEPGANRKIIFGIVGTLVIIIIALLIYWFLPTGEKEEPPVVVEEQPVQTQEQIALHRSQQELEKQLVNNFSNNSSSLTMAKNLLHSSYEGVEYSVLVVTQDLVQLSVLSNSPEQAEYYRNYLSNKFPQSSVKLVGTIQSTTDNTVMYLSDFYMNLAPTDASRPIGSYREVNSNSIKSVLDATAQNYQLRVQYFNKGKQTQSGLLKHTNYYYHLRGLPESVLNFLQDVINNYPAIKFTKIAINPGNFTLKKDGEVLARFIIILNEIRPN